MLSNCLRDVLELSRLAQVFARLDQLVHERHCFENVSKFDRAFILVNIQKMRKHDPLCKDALDFIEYFVAFLLDLLVALGHTAIDQAHADRSNLIDQ